MKSVSPPWVVFGAFDRHNLGDLLLPHVVGALLPRRQLVCAGLAARDLRPFGGHRVEAIADVAARCDAGGDTASVLHVGGEVVTCDAWTAAAMLLPPADAQAAIALFEHDAATREQWVRSAIGTVARAPYAVGGAFFRHLPRVGYLAVGGVDLGRADAALRAEVLAQLRNARVVTVRDRITLGHLQAAGIEATLLPDPAVMVAELFGACIAEAGRSGEVAAIRHAFAAGFLAVQCSAEFGDDSTLDALAAQLRSVHRDTGLAIVLFRAGAAPLHDDLPTLQRLASRVAGVPVGVHESLDIWQICALIGASRGVTASSLHARIVAQAFGVPRVTLRSPVAGTAKHAAYVATWDGVGDQPGVVGVAHLRDAMRSACAIPPAAHAAHARDLAAAFRAGFTGVVEAIDGPA